MGKEGECKSRLTVHRSRHEVHHGMMGAMVYGFLVTGLMGCAAGDVVNGAKIAMDLIKTPSGSSFPTLQNPFPFPLPTACLSLQALSWDLTKEGLAFKDEEAKVESALDRVNTAARLLEAGDLIMTTLPISGGSDWPKKANESVLPEAEVKLRQKLQQNQASSGRNTESTSALKLKALYLQTLLFSDYPDLFALRKLGVANPSEAEVQALQTKVLGGNSSPAFTKVFYRFLQYNPAFEPKAELFVGQLDGKATETYPSLYDAVVSLAENTNELKQLREAVLQAEEKKARKYRDILDLVQRIKKLEAAEFGTPSTADEAAEASKRDTNSGQVDELKEQLKVQEKEFETTVAAYKVEIEKMGLEMAKIKTQAIAFTPEQRALAVNIQTAVDAVKGEMCQTQLLLAMAGYHLQKAAPSWQNEVQAILHQGGPAATERIKRVTLNLATLPANLSVLTTESEVLEKEVKAYDGLFGSRIAIDTAGGGTASSGSGVVKALEG